MATWTKAGDAGIDYPESDGQPMAETDIHINLVIDLRERLKARYADRPDVYVSGNLFVYYEQGKPHKVLAPDGFVVFGVPPGERRTFKTWVEGHVPDVVFEFTSLSTQREDLIKKFAIYQDVWKVREYFLFDPFEEYLDPPLLGFRLVRGELQPIKPGPDGIVSRTLGLSLHRDGTRLILRDIKTRQVILTPAEQKAVEAEQKAVEAEQKAVEAEQKAVEAEQKAVEAEQKAAQAQAEIARLRMELDALRRSMNG